MRRRAFIATATAATSAGLAGCSILGDDGDDGDGGGGDSPEQAVRVGVNALAEGDVEAFREAHHPDSSARPGEDYSMDGAEYTDSSVENVQVLEEGDGNATVEADVSYTVEFEVAGETQTETVSNTLEYELREYEGEWRIWATEGGEGVGVSGVQ